MYHYNEQKHAVEYTNPATEEKVSVDFKTFFTRSWVMKHLHWNGRYTKMINKEQWEEAYLLCDGFGKLDPLMAAVNDYDWSHVRDSSDEAMADVAEYLVKAAKWFGGSFDTIYEQHLNDIKRLQDAGIDINVLAFVVKEDQIV